MENLEAVQTRAREYHMAAEDKAAVHIAACATAIPVPLDIGQRTLQGVVGHAPVGEGGVDEEKDIGLLEMDAIAHIDEEVEHLEGVVHINIKHRCIGHVPAGLVHVALIGEIYLLVASLQEQEQQGQQGECSVLSFHWR